MTIVGGYQTMTPADLWVGDPVCVVERREARYASGSEPIYVGQDVVDSGVWGAKILDDKSGLFRLCQDPSRLQDCERVAANALKILIDSAPSVESVLVPTDDGGLTLEFAVGATGRELLFAIPSDGSVRYFTARGPDGFRRAGIVNNDLALSELARWIEISDADFPSMGLDLG